MMKTVEEANSNQSSQIGKEAKASSNGQQFLEAVKDQRFGIQALALLPIIFSNESSESGEWGQLVRAVKEQQYMHAFALLERIPKLMKKMNRTNQDLKQELDQIKDEHEVLGKQVRGLEVLVEQLEIMLLTYMDAEKLKLQQRKRLPAARESD